MNDGGPPRPRAPGTTNRWAIELGKLDLISTAPLIRSVDKRELAPHAIQSGPVNKYSETQLRGAELSCGERRWNLEWDFAPVAASFVLLEMSSAVRVVVRGLEATSSESSAIRRRERPRDPRSRVSSSRASLFPGEIRPPRAPLVAGVHRPVASAASSVIYFGGCCFLEEKRRGGVSQRADTRDARGGDDDGDLSRTRSRGVARAGERAGRASRRFDRSPATRPPPCRPAPHIRRTEPQQRRSPRQPRPSGGRRARRRRRRREARAPRGVHRRGL